MSKFIKIIVVWWIMGKVFFVTTAIDYVNAEPHIGHAYQKVIADVLARWHKLNDEKVFFLTGTDEHGQKIERKAAEEKKDPKEFCDEMAKKFKDAWEELDVKSDRFIRTTDKDHGEFVKRFVKRMYERGDIYKGSYEGWYCVPCETFYTEKDLVEKSCPVHKRPAEYLSEKTYYFRMSKYQKKLLQWYEEHPEFVLPETRRNEIKNRVKEGLQDLSITRTSFRWGIPFPYDDKHILYVWYEALINYLSGAGKKQEYWPATLHLLGKDNGWFHAVIWPTMLFSAGYPLPRTVFVHGFLTVNGEKISKTLGNVISPLYLKKKYGADAVRYFLVREIPFGEDGNFSERDLVKRHNNELANEVGNLVSRTLTLIEKKLGGRIEKAAIEKELFKKVDVKKIKNLMEGLKLNEALAEIYKFVQASNKYISDKAPWKVEDKKEVNRILYNLFEAIRILSILLSPFIPNTAEKINGQLGIKGGKLKDAVPGKVKEAKVKKGEILFKKIEDGSYN